MIDFIVIGAQRSGTTSLRSYLAEHPSIGLSASKEAPFFGDEDAFGRGFDAYLADEFGAKRRDRPGSAPVSFGTVTPQYLGGGSIGPDPRAPSGPPELVVPARIHAELPDVRLVAVLRDPVERCLSHFRLNLWRGWESRSLTEMIDQQLTPEALAEARGQPADTNGFITRGEYGRLLAPYFELFGAEQIWVGFSDDLSGSPARFATEVFAHIGVDPDHVPRNLGRRHHASGEAWIGGDLRRKSTWRRILGGRHLPPTEPLWRRFVGRRTIPPDRLRLLTELGPDLRAKLAGHYSTDTVILEDLLGRPVPWATR